MTTLEIVQFTIAILGYGIGIPAVIYQIGWYRGREVGFDSASRIVLQSFENLEK